MKKLMLASLTVMLAGATAIPAIADSGDRRASGESSWRGAGNKGPARADREDVREARGESGREHRESGERGQQAPRADLRVAYPQSQARSAWEAAAQARTGEGHRAEGWTGGRGPGDGDSSRGRDGRDWSGDRDGRDGRDWSRDRDDDRHSSRHRDWRNEWREDRHDWRGDDRRDGRYYTRYRDSRWSGYQWYPQYRYRAPARYVYPYGYRPYRWTVGYRMPYHYYSPRHYWVDYRMYRLPPPPYGYTWVRVDRDVVLVELASGLIRDVLFGLFY